MQMGTTALKACADSHLLLLPVAVACRHAARDVRGHLGVADHPAHLHVAAGSCGNRRAHSRHRTDAVLPACADEHQSESTSSASAEASIAGLQPAVMPQAVGCCANGRRGHGATHNLVRHRVLLVQHEGHGGVAVEVLCGEGALAQHLLGEGTLQQQTAACLSRQQYAYLSPCARRSNTAATSLSGGNYRQVQSGQHMFWVTCTGVIFSWLHSWVPSNIQPACDGSARQARELPRGQHMLWLCTGVVTTSNPGPRAPWCPSSA